MFSVIFVSNFLIRDLQGFDVDVADNVGNCGLIYPCPNFDKNPRVFEELNKCSSKAIEDFNNKHVSVSFCVFSHPPNSSIIASLLGPLIRYYWCKSFCYSAEYKLPIYEGLEGRLSGGFWLQSLYYL